MSQIDDFLASDDKTLRPTAPPSSSGAAPKPQKSAIDDFLSDAPVPGRGILGHARDLGLSLAKGVIAVPESVVGLADIATGGQVGKALENEGGLLGFRAKQAKDYLSSLQTDQAKTQQQAFQDADGILAKTGVALSNPSMIANAVAESVPSIGLGGVAGRGLLAGARGLGLAAEPATAAIAARQAGLAAAAGEGLTGGGSAAEQIRQETKDGLLTGQQAALAGASGLATGAFGVLGSRVANRLGIGDADTMLVQGARGVERQSVERAAAATAPPSLASVPRKVVEGAISEGLLEELPQSVSEQLLQNIALGKPLNEGLDEAIVMGTLAGGAMGAGASGYHAYTDYRAGQQQAQTDPGIPQGAQAPPTDAPLALPPPAITVGADGTARTTDDRNSVLQRMADAGQSSIDDRDSTGVTPIRESQRPSEAMGLDPAAGPLSASAALAVDSGAHDQMARAAQAQADVQAQEQAAKKGGGKQADAGPLQSAVAETVDADGVITPQASAAPHVYPTYEDAQAYVMGQRRNGASVDGLPIAVEGGYSLAMRGTPAYEQAIEQRAQREQAKAAALSTDAAEFVNPTVNQPAATDALSATEKVAQAANGTSASTQSEPGFAAAHEAAPEPARIQSVLAKQIPAMTDAELTQAVQHYGPEHPRTAKLKREAARRAATQPATEGTTSEPQTNQAEQAPARPAQEAAAAPAVVAPAPRRGVLAKMDAAKAAQQAAAGKVQFETGPSDATDAARAAQQAPAAGEPAQTPVAPPAGMREEIERDTRLNDGEAERLLATGPTQEAGAQPDKRVLKAGPVDRPVKLGAPQTPTTPYTPPSGEVGLDWQGDGPGVKNPAFRATPRQQTVMDAVGKELDAGTFYNKEMNERVAKALGHSGDPQGQDFAYDVYLARQAVEAQRQQADLKKTAQAMPLKAGDAVGAVMDANGKLVRGMTVESVSDDGTRVKVRGKRGAVGVSADWSLAVLGSAIDRAKEKGHRRDDAVEFGASRQGESDTQPAQKQPRGVLAKLEATKQTVAAPAAPAAAAPASHSAPEKEAPSADAASATRQFASNKIFTADAVTAARARMKKKLGALNSGLDPELMMDGLVITGAYIESGVRNFGQYAKAMIADMGDGIRPYLLSFWESARHYPGVDKTGMTSAEDSAREHAALLEQKAEAATTETEPATPTDTQPKTLSASLLQAIRAGNMPKDNPALKKLAEAFDGKPADPARMKTAQEQLELAIVMAARETVAKGEGDQSTFAALLRVYESQPNLNLRTSTSIANQAYSTPAPLAYLATRLAGITTDTLTHEPTAGTGMLLMATAPDKAVVNELNDLRVSLLKEQGFKPTQKDAAAGPLTDPRGAVDAVITNPPFGSVKDADGKPVKVKVDGYSIGQIDHLIAANALATMKADGKAVLILGANKAPGGLSTDDRIFFNWLYSQYNVTGHFEVNGDLYARQGAGWPVRVISIAGRQRSNGISPVAGTIERADNWSQVYEQYRNILDSGGRPVAVASGVAGRASESQAGPAGVSDAAGGQTARPDRSAAAAGKGGDGNVAGAGARADADRTGATADPVGHIPDEQRINADSFVPPRLEAAGTDAKPAAAGSAKPAGTAAVADAGAAGNEFQSPYIARSSRKDAGVLIPANMAQPTQDALNRLEDAVGDIDEFARTELGYPTVAALHEALMGLQVDSVATAIHQIKQGKAVVIADQCVAAGTRIYDPVSNTHTAIEVLAARGEPIHVLSMGADGLVPAVASAPFRKGVADLFRVVMDDGREITVTRHHRFLTPSGWQTLADGLRAGCFLGCAEDHPLRSLEFFPSTHAADGPRSTGTPEGSMLRCSAYPHQGGEPLRAGADTDRIRAPSPADVLEHCRLLSHADGLDTSPECSRQHQSNALRSRRNSSPSESRVPSSMTGQAPASDAKSSAPTRQSVPLSVRSQEPPHQECGAVPPRQPARRCTSDDAMERLADEGHTELFAPAPIDVSQLLERVHRLDELGKSAEQEGRNLVAFGDYTGWRRIERIEFAGHDEFFDLWVPGYENYVAEGLVNHNTGIGKGRQAASIIRWAARQGMTPVFVSVKPSLFTDMYGDLADIGTHDVNPFVLNSDAWVAGDGGEKLFANKPATHRSAIQGIVSRGALPAGRNALFLTYSQINTDNIQRSALMALSSNAVFVLDESHNAAGASATGEFMIGALGAAKGVVYLSATYAKRPDNMPLYFKTDIGDAAADSEGLSAAMSAGGLPLQTVVSNNLVKAGQMFRRERSYDGVSIASTFDTKNRAMHERMSDTATQALRAIVSADRMFHEVYVKALDKELKKEGAQIKDSAGNQITRGVQHTEFSSVVHNFVKQMLLGLKAQTAADEAIASLKRGEKPIIAVENTMGSFLAEYAAQNGIAQGDSLGAFDYRTVLSRALARSRVVVEVAPNGDKIKREVPLAKLDPLSRKAYDAAQAVIDGLKLDIPVSPIDWMRAEIARAGFSVAEITGRNLSVDYTNPAKPALSAIDASEQQDKVATTRRFNGGELDALILNVAGSTGISLHASEKFADQRQRHMIVGQAAGDINIFMQMLGRVHRTGQVKLPKYTILSVDLPTEKRPTAVLSRKMKSLNANTSSNTESATSVKTADILNKYGDQIVNQYLQDNPELTRALDLTDLVGETVEDDIARKATGRLALQSIEAQHAFYDDVEAQYDALIEYLNKTNQNDLEPRTFDFDAKETRQEVLFDGPNKETPFGQDAIYGEYSIKAQGNPMTPAEINAQMRENLGGKDPVDHVASITDALQADMAGFLARQGNDEQRGKAQQLAAATREFLGAHRIGSTFRVDINSEPYNAVVTNLRSTHKGAGNPFSLSKVQVTIAVNGALRSLTVPATQLRKIEVSRIAQVHRIEQLFKEQPPNQRETAKIVTGNLLAAYGELKDVRGTIVTFTKQDGTSEQGILLPKQFDYGKNTQGDFRLRSGADALRFLQSSTSPDIGRFGIASRDSVVRVVPLGQGVQVRVPKSKVQGAKYFLDKGLIAVAGDFVSTATSMTVKVEDPAKAVKLLDLLMKKQALYVLPSMAEEAKAMAAPEAASDAPAFSRADTSPEGKSEKRRAATERLVEQLAANWTRTPEIIVARNMQDDSIPPRVRDYDAKLRSQGGAGDVRGFVYDGKVYLLSDHLPNPQAIAETLFHEVLGHHGLRGVFGKTLDPILRQVGIARRADVLAKARSYGLSSAQALRAQGAASIATASDAQLWAAMTDAQRLTAAEEVLAEMAEKNPQISFVQRAVAAIRNWLRQNMPGFSAMELSDADIVQAYLLPARGYVTRGANETTEQAIDRAMAAFSRTGEPTDSAAFKAWFGNSKAVDANGRPLVVYHGTNKAFDVFNTAAGPRSQMVGDWDGVHFTNDRAQAQSIANSLARSEGGTAQVVEAYLRAENPTEFGRYRTQAQAQAAGHDSRLTENNVGLQEWTVFDPAQIKSATDNNGAFDPGNDDIRFSRTQAIGDTLRGITATDLRAKAGNRLADYRGLGLQFLGGRQIDDLYGKLIPQLPEYTRMVQQMSADANEVGANADEVATAWGKLKDERQLAELMHDATLAQIDAAKPHVQGDDRARHTTLSARFKALSPEAQRIYAQARDGYEEHYAQVREAIRDKIERSAMNSEAKADMLARMDGEFFDKIKGVYFPLSRFGKYVVVVRDAAGQAINVSRAETLNEAEALRKSLRTSYPGAQVGKVLRDKEFNAARDAVGRGFLKDLFGMLDKQGVGEELQDAVNQLYLASMPDLSWAKHGIHRKGTPGFSQDARRAYAQNMFHGARYLAKLRYADQLQERLDQMQKHVELQADNEQFDSVKGQQVVDELYKRNDSLMNPKSNPLSTALTSFGFVFHLGLSPASAMVNLSQTALVAYPIMGAKWGFDKSAAALAVAAKQAAANKNDISTVLTGDEQRAYTAAVNAGTIDVTNAHDLAGIAQGEDSKVSWKLRPVMKWASFLFHHAERFNRQVTFVAAYRLARAAGTAHDAAFEQATKATYDGHFDYMSSNRPRVMQGNVAKVALLFKQFGQNMVFTLARQAQLAINAETPEGRKEARKALGGLLAMHAMGAGVLGLPFVSTLLAAASMLGGSDDEPWDAEVALRNLLADAFGQKPAEVMARGFSRLTPWDVSKRVGLDSMILPDIQEGLEGQRMAEAAMTAALGPVAGIGVNVLKGLQAMTQGEYGRGLEAMLPAVLRGPMKAARYAEEGARDKTGIVIKDEVGTAGILGQAIGFSPSEVRNATEGRSAIYSADQRLSRRRAELMGEFAHAYMKRDDSGVADAREAVAAFNAKNPDRRINPVQLMQSVRAREKRIRDAKDGIYLPKSHRGVQDEGRFASVQ